MYHTDVTFSRFLSVKLSVLIYKFKQRTLKTKHKNINIISVFGKIGAITWCSLVVAAVVVGRGVRLCFRAWEGGGTVKVLIQQSQCMFLTCH